MGVRALRIERQNLRHRAIGLLEQWYFDREASTVSSPHPLVVVQEMALADGGGGGPTGTRAAGKSRPPIRDLPHTSRRVDQIMRHIKDVDRAWAAAMELYVQHGSFRKAAQARNLKADLLFREFNQGIAVLQAEMVRTGL